jgi:predicted nucleotidyltransferase
MLAPDEVGLIAKLLDERLGLDALWVFGSVAAGAVTETSDVDLAGLFRRTPSAVELIEIGEEIGRLVSGEVDLVDLARASCRILSRRSSRSSSATA